MAFEKRDGVYHTFTAVSTGLKQYQFVALASTTSSRLINPTTEGLTIGVITSSGTTGSTGKAGSTDSGSAQTVQLSGIGKVIAGTTKIAPGGYVKASTDGLAAQTTGPTSTSYVGGIALQAVASTSTSSEVIAVLLNPTIGMHTA